MNIEKIKQSKEYWWYIDLQSKQLFLSESIKKLCGIVANSFESDEMLMLVNPECKSSILERFSTIEHIDSFENIEFELLTSFGYRWARSVVEGKSQAGDGTPLLVGYLEFLRMEEISQKKESQEHPLNNPITRSTSIPDSLLNLLYEEDKSKVVLLTLQNLLSEFRADRVYIFEYDVSRGTQSCTYEVVRDEEWSEQVTLQDIFMDDTKWWTQKLFYERESIAFSNIKDLPEEAAIEFELLERQGIKSLLVVPFITKDGVDGYLGLDMVERHREWSSADKEWFKSLANILSLCIELKKREEAALLERKRYLKLYNTMPIGFIRILPMFDALGGLVDFVFEEANSVAESILSSMGAKVCKGMKGSAISWMAAGNFMMKVKELIEKRKIIRSTFRIGHYYVDYILYTLDGHTITVLIQDKTEAILANHALRKSEEMFQNIYNNIPIGIELYNKEGILIDINDVELDIFGLDNKEVALGVNLFDNPNLPKPFLDDLLSGRHANCDFFYDFNKVGTYYSTSSQGLKHIVLKGTVLYDIDKNVENYLLIVIDNTDTLRASHKIHEFEVLFNSIAEFSEVGLCQWNLHDNSISGTDQWYANLNINNRDLPSIMDAYAEAHAEDKSRLAVCFDDIISGRINSFRQEVRIKEGTVYKWLSTSFKVSEHAPDEEQSEIIGINIDITQLKNTELKLIQARYKAEESDRLKSAFLANMSHEIRTPLNAIVGFSHLLVDAVDMQDRQEYASIIRQNNDLLLQLVSDVLDLSKIESGLIVVKNEKILVDDLCSELIVLNSDRLSSDVRIECATVGRGCELVIDKVRLSQVLLNLVNNAIKFTQKGTITLGYNEYPGELRFFVRDTGVGIPADQLDSVFSRFVKLNSFVPGTGLGLTICKGLVNIWGGKIWVESEPGVGSCFYVSVPYDAPLVASAVMEQVVVEPIVENPALVVEKPVLLIAEDTDSNYLLMSTILKRDYTLVRALNGLEAIELFERCKPRLILMDMKMPEMGGLEATRRIKALDTEIPIVMVTAFAFDDDRKQALSAGCVDYLTKPIQVELLKATIRKYLQY